MAKLEQVHLQPVGLAEPSFRVPLAKLGKERNA
jgi:hypothetical protein